VNLTSFGRQNCSAFTGVWTYWMIYSCQYVSTVTEIHLLTYRQFFGTAYIVCGRVYVTVGCPSTCLSICLSVPSVDRCSRVYRVCCWVPCKQEMTEHRLFSVTARRQRWSCRNGVWMISLKRAFLQVHVENFSWLVSVCMCLCVVSCLVIKKS